MTEPSAEIQMTEPSAEIQKLTSNRIQPTPDNKIREDGSLLPSDDELNNFLLWFGENTKDTTLRLDFLDELAKRGDVFHLALFYHRKGLPKLEGESRLRELELLTKLFQNAVVRARRSIEYNIKNGGDEMLARLVDDPDEFFKKYLKLKERTEKLRRQLEKQK